LGILIILLYSGCQRQEETSEQVLSSRDIFAMDTYMNLKIYCDNSETAQEALQAGENLIQDLENKFSVTNPDSDISFINQSAGTPVQVSSDTVNLLETACTIGNASNGALDISIYPVLKAWGFTTQNYQIPDENLLKNLLNSVDYTKISIENNFIQIPEDFQIDVGALAKGYTSDKLIALFQEYGTESAVINLGGNVQTLGTKPDGSFWNVAVVNPFSPSENMCILQIADKAVITSGNYERYFIGEDDNIYWHIIDPADGYPANNGLISVTIIGESGLLCDALSTAIFIMGTEQAISYWRLANNFDMILVTDTGEIFITETIADSFQNISSLPVEVIFYDEAS
ncbi:MAG: FAD:protein FMN transferase, partial [Oscillospiraceae bacterium]|nr:FAD:protein FMN transferase [Oscillospiraceae bacterium]